MLRKDFIVKSPLRAINPAIAGPGEGHRMGLVMARAGLGKTAILVQIALDSLMRGNQVLHVSIDHNLDKTRAWYHDIFEDMATAADLEGKALIRDEILHNRLIMSFNESAFSQAKFEERLNDLVSQNIFKPNCVMVDGLDFTAMERKELQAMRELIEAKGLQVWYSAVSHRDDRRESEAGVPAPCHELDDLFNTVILLQNDPQTKCLVLKVVKDDTGVTDQGNILHLDPATLRIKP